MSQPCHITPEKFPERDCYGMRGNTESTQPRGADGTDARGNSAHVEPSGDDTLTEILSKLMVPSWVEASASDNEPEDTGPTAEEKLADARTQLLQYIEGIIGEDEWLEDGLPIANKLITARNHLRAEQRQRLRGKL